MPVTIDPVLAKWFETLPEFQRQSFMVDIAKVLSSQASFTWQPNPDHEDGTPNTQRLALESEADILGLSGVAGYGKTDLALGLARLHHHHSVIFRRIFKNLRAIIERSREIYNPDNIKHTNDSYNESLHRWKFATGQQIEFEAIQYEADKSHQKGRPRDLYVFDEVTEFTKTQVEFALGWMRSAKPGQRCRAIFTFNPPSDTDGEWVTLYFLPWIAYLFPAKYSHPNPAKPGELRWYTTLDNGDEIERENGEPFERDGRTYRPISRSFLFGTLDDNPHLKNTNYTAILSAMPEPERSRLLYGNFAADAKSHPRQIIPTEWVRASQRRWLEREKLDMPLSGVGVDVARGGRDNLTIAKRYGDWYDEIVKIPGVDIQNGPAAAKAVYDNLQDEKHIGYINVDIINVGTSAYDSLEGFYDNVYGINASERSDYIYQTPDGKPLYRMVNKRAEMHWRMREALDPERGSTVCLPPGNEIVADLCAAQYIKIKADPTQETLGIMQTELKDEIKKRIGRSPDVGDAVMMANMEIQVEQEYYQVDYNPVIIGRGW